MDYLKTQLEVYKEASQKEPKAKRALILALHHVVSISATLEREIKDRPTFEALFDKMASQNSKMVKDMARLTELLSLAKKDLDIVRNDRRKRSAAPRATAAAAAAAIATANPVVNVVVNNYTGASHQKPNHDAETTVPQTGGMGTNLREKRPHKLTVTREMREAIWEKYIGDKAKVDCPVCQKRIIRMTDFSAGHIEAESRGGVTDATNLIPICSNCNCRMSTENLFEYTRKNFGRDPVFPGLVDESARAPVPVPVPAPAPAPAPMRKARGYRVIKHEHCRAISGNEVDKQNYETDKEAIAYAKEKGYTTITHKTGGNAAYYFAIRSNMKFKIAEDSSSGAWGFTSWELIY
jgi:hypothetical protein